MTLRSHIPGALRRGTEAVIAVYLAGLGLAAAAGARVASWLLCSVRFRRGGRQWNPLRSDAWYWGRRNQALRRGVSVSAAAHGLLIVACMLPALWGGLFGPGVEEYFLPGGGGGDTLPGSGRKEVKMIVKLAPRSARPKFVLSKSSLVKFSVPGIDLWGRDSVDQPLADATSHRYQPGAADDGTGGGEGQGAGSGSGGGKLGQGKGKGAGFGSGRIGGTVRFIRLQYDGGDWDNNFREGADLNLLLEFGARSGMKVAREAESRTIRDLAAFRLYASPPLVYITGQKDLTLSDREVQILHEYLVDKHGMLLADNGGSATWGRRFRAVMRRVLPGVEPVHIPLDDRLYQRPYALQGLPFASPHDPPMEASGWLVDGRWAVIYHPGDIGDAWKSGHSGLSNWVVESAYQFGVNVIYDAHLRYATWIEATRGKQ